MFIILLIIIRNNGYFHKIVKQCIYLMEPYKEERLFFYYDIINDVAVF